MVFDEEDAAGVAVDEAVVVGGDEYRGTFGRDAVQEGEDALAGDATLCSTDGMWNLRIKDPDASSDGASQGFDDLSGVIGTSVHHREQDPVNLQVRIDTALNL